MEVRYVIDHFGHVCGAAGLAGVLSYVSSEVLFWVSSLPLGVLAYHQSTGEWLDLSTADGQAKVSDPCNDLSSPLA